MEQPATRLHAMSRHLHCSLLVTELKKGETDKLHVQAPVNRSVRVVSEKKVDDSVDNFTPSTLYTFSLFTFMPLDSRRHAVAQWLRHCATNRKVTGSIPDGVIGIFPSGRTMALGSTQPRTEMSTRTISWG
jgi:hypothetical protein